MDYTTRDDECDDSLEPTTLPSTVPEEAHDYVLNVQLLPKELQPVADIFDDEYQSTKTTQVLNIVNDVKARGEKAIIFVRRLFPLNSPPSANESCVVKLCVPLISDRRCTR
jgi:hypothetical protein